MKSLLDFIPDSHTRDPESSRRAAAEHRRSGRRDSHAAIMYRLVGAFPDQTATELYELASQEDQRQLKEPQESRRRLHSLHKVGLVRQGIERACKHRRTLMVTWHRTPAGELTEVQREFAERLLRSE